ncbi:MAG: glucosaminidase domain-containing protein, partial [Pseudomonadota bacterium]
RAEPFRAYDSLASGFADYVRLLGTSARYADAVATGRDPRAFARALQDAGYATDPDYARKIDAILRGDTLREALAALKDPAAGPM